MSLKSTISKTKAAGATAVLARSIQCDIIDPSLISPNISAIAISNEDNEQDIAEITRTAVGLGDALESIKVSLESMSESNIITQSSQILAGQLAGMVAGDAGAFMSRKMTPLASSGKNSFLVDTTSMEDAYDDYGPAMEAYDERENKNAVLYAITYNIQASRQDELGESWFPTVVISPDEVGLSIETRVVSVYKDFSRSASGVTDGEKFQTINILRGYRDHSILGNESTKIIPVKDAGTGSDALFSTEASLDSVEVNAIGNSVSTGFLKFDTPFSLLAISQTQESIQKGLYDSTDSLSPMINLDSIALQTGTGAATNRFVALKTNGLPKSNFTYSTQGNDREMTLAFDTRSVLVDTNTLATDGAVWSAVASLTAGTKILLSVSIYGSSQLETGDTTVFANSITVDKVYDVSGNELTSGTTFDAVVTAIGITALEGFKLESFRTNANRRDRGALIKSNNFVQSYAVPVRAPVTTLRPTGANEDMNDLKALVNVTHVRTSNSAIKAITEAAELLSETVTVGQQVSDILGVGRFLVKPYFKDVSLDMLSVVDSLTSTDRADDVQSALLNSIRDAVFNMYSESEYQVAADALAGGRAGRPTVIIATDPVIGRYLDTNTNIKILSDVFEVKITTSLDTRLAGKMFISFGVYDSNRNESVNPLNFGTMAWAPEVTANLQVSRGGQTSKEISVQPRFRHIVNLPCMLRFTVSNLTAVQSKVTQNVSQ